MSLSFKDIAKLMDPVKTPNSLRELAALHRWSDGNPPIHLSMKTFSDRHRHHLKAQQRFLFYNAFLLPEVEIPVGVFIGAIVAGPVGAVIGAALDAAGITKITIEDPKPALEPRAHEIGYTIRREYDIAALCEVFKKREKERILEAWPADHQPFSAAGPDDSGLAMASSGLFTINNQYPIVQTRIKRHKFKNKGKLERDADAWSNKGVLLTEIDLGLPRGGLEIYSTHIFAGNSLLDETDLGTITIGGNPSDIERHNIRLKQVDELIDFVKRHHQPQNVAMIVGDFNLPVNKDGYGTDDLIWKMQEIDMEDIWITRGDNTYGYTTKMDDKDKADRICPIDTNDNRYCDDLLDPGEKISRRIDHIFIEKQKPEHGFILDFTRPRRVRFERSASARDRDKIAYMSDHLGLTTTLIATPR